MVRIFTLRSVGSFGEESGRGMNSKPPDGRGRCKVGAPTRAVSPVQEGVAHRR